MADAISVRDQPRASSSVIRVAQGLSMRRTLRNSVSLCQRHSVTAFRSNPCMRTGDRIRAEREAQKISRTELARYAGIATSTLSDLELGLSKGTTALHKIAERLGVNPTWLETGRGAKHPSHPMRSDVIRITSRRDELGLSNADVHARMLADQWPEGVPPPSLATVEEWFDGKARPLDMVYRGMLYKALELVIDPGESSQELVASTQIEADFLRMARSADPDETAQVMLLWKQIREAKGKP